MVKRVLVTLALGAPLAVWLKAPWYVDLSIFGLIGMLYEAAGWHRE